MNRFLAACIALLALSACAPLAAGPATAETAVVPELSSLPMKPLEQTPDPPQFYVPDPNQGATAQIAALAAAGQQDDAQLIQSMIATPQAVWFTQGTPRQIEQTVRALVEQANRQGTVPVLVAYNIPFRDCAQFSAGGATTVAEYQAWIDAFAAGIGEQTAVVIPEPDGLGIIPWYKQFRGTAAGASSYEWCQPGQANTDTAAGERFAMLNYAVDALKAQPNTHVYLDGTHSAWISVPDAAHRLLQAGVERADGFFLNVSNYQPTEAEIAYGSMISDCIHLAQHGGPLVQECAANKLDEAFATVGLTRDPGAQAHFVIDTSRNGRGPWNPTTSYPDPQAWCNPPERGLGLRPTGTTGQDLVDAYLWIKTPGESDGECTRGLGKAGSTVDPEWNMVAPAAGRWFAEMALQLAQNASPPLK